MIKNLIIIVLLAIVVGLIYFILLGNFCHCEGGFCPRYQKNDTIKIIT